MMLLAECNWTFLGASAGQIVVAIITSLIASIVFWFAFDRVPKWFNQKKVQPLIDYNFYQVYMTMFFFLETPFRPSKHVSSQFQEELFSGKITKDDFRTVLSTKCLSVEYWTVDEISKQLVPIGNELKKKADEITTMINQLFVFHEYLTIDQILFSRQILDTLNKYSFDMPAFVKAGNGVVLGPVNPTAVTLLTMFVDLYAHFTKLQDYLINSSRRDSFNNYRKDLIFREAYNLLLNNKLNVVIRKTRHAENHSLTSLYIRALYKKKGAKAVRPVLISFLQKENTDLISCRHTFKEMVNDELLKETLISMRSQTEYDEMVRCLDKESAQKAQYWQFAREIETYYAEKAKSV